MEAWTLLRTPGLLLAVSAVGCGPTIIVEGGGSTGVGTAGTVTGQASLDGPATMTGSPTTASPPTTATSGGGSEDATDTAPVDDSDDAVDDAAVEDGGFIFDDFGDWDCGEDLPPGTMAHCSFECDVWAQDCPEDEKCAPWANDGGDWWNATRCTPVAPNPGMAGDACTAEGGAFAGFDTCALGHVCMYVDPNTDEGECVPMCTGDQAAPMCEDADTACLIHGEGSLAVCLATCDPVEGDCGEAQVCTGVETFVCLPEHDDPRAYGEACSTLNRCQSGLACVGDPNPSCDAETCCTAYCALSDGDPNPACLDAAHSCTPYFIEGEAPEGLEDLGVCATI